MRVHAIAAVAAGALLTLSCSSVRPIAIHDGEVVVNRNTGETTITRF